MVTHSFYESDNRVMRYAEALAGRGDQVDVFALRRSPELPAVETINGVRLFRIQDRLGKSERSKISYLWPLLRFLAVSSVWLTREHHRRAYDLAHIHNVPDFMVFAAWYLKLSGKPILLDIHDIVPEFFASKFRIPPRGLLVRLLYWMERASAAFADKIIIANHLWLEKYAARTGANGRCSAFINNVDRTVFTLAAAAARPTANKSSSSPVACNGIRASISPSAPFSRSDASCPPPSSTSTATAMRGRRSSRSPRSWA